MDNDDDENQLDERLKETKYEWATLLEINRMKARKWIAGEVACFTRIGIQGLLSLLFLFFAFSLLFFNLGTHGTSIRAGMACMRAAKYGLSENGRRAANNTNHRAIGDKIRAQRRWRQRQQQQQRGTIQKKGRTQVEMILRSLLLSTRRNNDDQPLGRIFWNRFFSLSFYLFSFISVAELPHHLPHHPRDASKPRVLCPRQPPGGSPDTRNSLKSTARTGQHRT
ncbi:MAG: hypothetical protein J3R72DRAFT_452874 [Linnemannia gamsii]|nr:MAG: hypothetical protein J3R72DRAFT_452874 [Linnemannia gamsii]